MAQVPNSSLYAYQDGLVVTAAQLNQDIQVLQTALNDNYYRLLRSVTVNGTAYQLQGTSGIINNVNLNTDSTVSATSSSDSQGNITVTFSVASGAISSGKIANGAVGTAQIANQAVTQALIANQAVGTPQIANYAVGVNQLDPTLVQQTSINLVQAKLAEAVLGLRNLLHPSQQSFTRASSAWRINGTAYVPSNVLRLEQGKFGQGAFIEESTTNLVPNSGFEDVTTTATLFSDALTSYTGSTVPAPWTLQSGSFTFGASGATSGATNSEMVSGNAVWKPVLGTDGTTKLAQTVQDTLTTPSNFVSTNNMYVVLHQDGNFTSGHLYILQSGYGATSNTLTIAKLSGTTFTQLAQVAFTWAASTSYTFKLSIDNTGLLTGSVTPSGGATTTLNYTDSSPLTGGFLIGVGGDTGVVISNASVTAPWANAWTIGGDSRVAWGLTQSAIGGKYSVSAVGVASGVAGYISSSNGYNYTNGNTYTGSVYVTSNGVGASGVYMSVNTNVGVTTNKVTGTNTNPIRLSAQSTATATGTNSSSLFIDDVGTVTFDNIQLEQKAYATTYVEVTSAASGATATRSADSLSYNLSNPLPSTWFGALVWTPEFGSSQLANSSTDKSLLWFMDNNGNWLYNLQFSHTPDTFVFQRNGGASINSSTISFNAGDRVFLAFLCEPTSSLLQLCVSVNGGTVSTFTATDATSVTTVQQIYVGCRNGVNYEANGTIDFPIISDVIPSVDQITSLAQATDWGGMRDWAGALPDKVRVGSHTEINETSFGTQFMNLDSGFNLLGAAFNVGQNCYTLDGNTWNRIDTTKSATIITVDSAGQPCVFYAPAGANPISWQTSDAKFLQAFSGGYKVQSGMTSASCTGSATTSITVTLPTALKSQTSPVVASASANGYNIRVTQAFAISLNQLTIVVYNESATVTAPISWVVIDNG